jgi:hypothetical protein
METTRERATKEFDHVRSGLAALTAPVMAPGEDPASFQGEGSTQGESAQATYVDAQPRVTAGSMMSYLKSTADAAQKKLNPTLKELSKAEDAADAYLNKLGASFGQLLKDVVTIAPPADSVQDPKEGDVLFDTKAEKKI